MVYFDKMHLKLFWKLDVSNIEIKLATFGDSCALGLSGWVQDASMGWVKCISLTYYCVFCSWLLWYLQEQRRSDSNRSKNSLFWWSRMIKWISSSISTQNIRLYCQMILMYCRGPFHFSPKKWLICYSTWLEGTTTTHLKHKKRLIILTLRWCCTKQKKKRRKKLNKSGWETKSCRLLA